MENIIALVVLISLVSLVIGLIKPSIVIKWGKDRTRKQVLITYGLILLGSLFAIGMIAPKQKNADINQVAPTQNKQTSVTQNDISSDETKSTRKIDVRLEVKIQNINGKLKVVGDTNLPNGMKLIVYISNDLYNASDEVEVKNGKFISNLFSDKGNPLYNGQYEIYITNKSLNMQPKDVLLMIGEKGENLNGKYIKTDDWGLNKINYTTVYTIDNSQNRKEIQSITSDNIKKVIKILKEHYNIIATDFNGAKLNKFKICSNENFCEVFANKIQIQAISKKVEALTTSQVSPKQYQQVCSAIMIALTGANSELVEQSMQQYFNYASQNGATKWNHLGIEVKIIPNSNGLLGCEFYKK